MQPECLLHDKKSRPRHPSSSSNYKPTNSLFSDPGSELAAVSNRAYSIFHFLSSLLGGHLLVLLTNAIYRLPQSYWASLDDNRLQSVIPRIRFDTLPDPVLFNARSEHNRRTSSSSNTFSALQRRVCILVPLSQPFYAKPDLMPAVSSHQLSSTSVDILQK